MRLLLTDSGITNPTIRSALVDLLGKPIAECAALVIPTATYAHPYAGPTAAYRTIVDKDGTLSGLGWKSVGVLELTALPSIDREQWLPAVQEADVLLVDGGDGTYLYHWLRESGLADLLPTLRAVWVGLSAGSMVMTPRIGQEFVTWSRAESDETLGIVDFAIFPHLDYPGFEDNTMAKAQMWAAQMPMPVYAIDHETAITVVDGTVEVVSEGTWRLFNRPG